MDGNTHCVKTRLGRERKKRWTAAEGSRRVSQVRLGQTGCHEHNLSIFLVFIREHHGHVSSPRMSIGQGAAARGLVSPKKKVIDIACTLARRCEDTSTEPATGRTSLQFPSDSAPSPTLRVWSATLVCSSPGTRKHPQLGQRCPPPEKGGRSTCARKDHSGCPEEQNRAPPSQTAAGCSLSCPR